MQEEFEVCYLPYLSNIKPFLDWMKVQIQENPKYDIASNTIFEANTISEILQSWMIDPSIQTTFHRKDGFGSIEYDLFNETFKDIVGNEYSFIDNTDKGYRNYEPELLEYIKYAMVESMVCDFFQPIRKPVFHYHKEAVDRITRGLSNYEDNLIKMDKLHTKLTPEEGKADTKAGEFIRAVAKIVYHIMNDGDNPSNYAARQSQFWSMVHCYDVIISSNANYRLYLSIITEKEKKRCRGFNYQIYFSSEIDEYTIINLINFGLAYAETAEGKEENLINCIKPAHKNVDWYDDGIPMLESINND